MKNEIGKSIRELIFDENRINSNENFLIYPERDYILSYNSLYTSAMIIAENLHEKGVRKGDRISIFFDNIPESILVAFGAMYLGAVLVPLEPDSNKNTIESIVIDSNSKYVIGFDISQKEVINVLDNFTGKYLYFNEINFKKSRLETFTLSDLEKTDELIILYTSGSTNKPKGVVFTYGRVIHNFITYGNNMGFNNNTRFLQVMPIYHADGWNFSILVPYLFNSSVVLTRKFNASVCANLSNVCLKYACNVIVVIPSILDAIIYFYEYRGVSKINSIEYVITSSERLTAKTKSKFEEMFNCNVYDLYGLTETQVISYYNNKINWKENSVGKLQDGIEVKINNEGEILIKSPYVLEYTDEKLTNEVFNSGWYSTGDYGYLDSENYLYLDGRKNNIINKGGVKIMTYEIDQILCDYPLIVDALTLGKSDEIYGQEIYSFVIFNKEDILSAEINDSIKAHFLNRSIIEKFPKRIIPIKAFPKNKVGKIDRKKMFDYLEEILM